MADYLTYIEGLSLEMSVSFSRGKHLYWVTEV